MSVLVPKGRSEFLEMRAGNASLDQVAKLVPIQGGEIFNKIWESGIFQRVNWRCGSIIDEYEEEWVDGRGVRCIHEVAVEILSGKAVEPDLRDWLNALVDAAGYAVKYNLPVLFVL
jgi:hypothetical protein